MKRGGTVRTKTFRRVPGQNVQPQDGAVPRCDSQQNFAEFGRGSASEPGHNQRLNW